MSREGIRCTYRQIRDAEYTLAPRFVPLSGLVAEPGRAGCNETIVERKNEKEFLACLRNRDRAGPKFTLRQCTLRRLSAPETALCALSFRPHFFLSLFLPSPLSSRLFPFLFHHAGWHWILALTLRFAPKPQKFLGDGFLFDSRRKMPNSCARRAG